MILSSSSRNCFTRHPKTVKPSLTLASPAMTRKTIWSGKSRCLSCIVPKQGWTFEVIVDLGSGMNYSKKGLKRLLDEIIEGRVGRLVIAHKDRLLRFGAELVFAICEAKDVEVLIINKGVDTTFEEDLAKDVLEIITVFSARLYGSRSRKNHKLLDGVKQAVQAASC